MFYNFAFVNRLLKYIFIVITILIYSNANAAPGAKPKGVLLSHQICAHHQDEFNKYDLTFFAKHINENENQWLFVEPDLKNSKDELVIVLDADNSFLIYHQSFILHHSSYLNGIAGNFHHKYLYPFHKNELLILYQVFRL